MKNNKITTLTRVTLLICGMALLIVLVTPIWRIDLSAPQYPEGLSMFIYANKLAGNIDIINGLNHYIGMKTLKADDFVEFTVLPYIIGFYSICFIIAAIVANRKLLYLMFGLFVAFGVLAMVDFWRWEYDYGHDLNPDAAIVVPGMAYQPPLIGYKQLLNFGAWSVPAIGGWIFVTVGILLLAAVIYEWKRRNKINMKPSTMPIWMVGILTLSLSSCSTDPEPIRIGKDNCDFCKMTISDHRFGAEIVTKKGKIYKFDDAHCIKAFMVSNTLGQEEISGIYFTDFLPPNYLVNVEQAFFLQSPKLKSPMNGNIAAFTKEDSLIKTLPQYPGFKISWEDAQK